MKMTQCHMIWISALLDVTKGSDHNIHLYLYSCQHCRQFSNAFVFSILYFLCITIFGCVLRRRHRQLANEIALRC